MLFGCWGPPFPVAQRKMLRLIGTGWPAAGGGGAWVCPPWCPPCTQAPGSLQGAGRRGVFLGTMRGTGPCSCLPASPYPVYSRSVRSSLARNSSLTPTAELSMLGVYCADAAGSGRRVTRIRPVSSGLTCSRCAGRGTPGWGRTVVRCLSWVPGTTLSCPVIQSHT